MPILLFEDDVEVSEILKESLKNKYKTDIEVYNKFDLFKKAARSEKNDLIICDSIAYESGRPVILSKLEDLFEGGQKGENDNTPVIMLTDGVNRPGDGLYYKKPESITPVPRMAYERDSEKASRMERERIASSKFAAIEKVIENNLPGFGAPAQEVGGSRVDKLKAERERETSKGRQK
jgi:hypothetical protein